MRRLLRFLIMIITSSLLLFGCNSEILDSIKADTEISNNGPMPVLKDTEKIINTVYEQLTEVEKSTLKLLN